MSKLRLPDVTLVMVETREHELANLAVMECLEQVEFGDVLILTDKPEAFDCHFLNRARFHAVPDWPDKLGWARAMWYEVPYLMQTSHMLAIQWDSWVVDATKWQDMFLTYDYIGAPWPFHAVRRVGNSGFCIKSTKLARYIADRRGRYPCSTSVEDDLLCRNYRVELEKFGFEWAPESVAKDFSFECELHRGTFGFHAAFNFPFVIEEEKRLIERVNLMVASPYIRDSYIFKTFCQKHPGLVEQITRSMQQGEN